MFKYKTAAQIKAMTEAEQDTYASDKQAHEESLRKAEIAAGIQAWKDSDEFKAMFKAPEVTKKAFDELTEKYNQLLEKGNGEAGPISILKAVTPIFEEIKAAVKTNLKKEWVIKADTLRASVTGNANALDLTGIGQLAFPKLQMYDVFRKVPVPKDANGTIRYTDWDAATTVRAAAAVAEGASFPESTAKWQVYSKSLEKIGDTLPVSEEFFYDAAQFAAELENFLRTNVMIKINNDLVNGSGVTPNIAGILIQVPNYVPAAAGIVNATIYDLAVVVSAKISTLYGSKYSPNVILMNSNSITKYKLSKDANNNYIMPPFVTKDGQTIDGKLVLEVNQLADNTMIVGDNRYGAIYEEPGFTVETGYSGTDFTDDMRTLKARKRVQLIIRTVDQTGWLEVTDIDAALLVIEG